MAANSLNKTRFLDDDPLTDEEKITAKAIWKIELDLNNEESKKAHGSGFFISPSAIITNFHVINNFLSHKKAKLEDINIIQDGNPKQLKFNKILRLSHLYDLALLEVSGSTDHFLELAPNPSIYDDNLSVIGYAERLVKINQTSRLKEGGNGGFTTNHSNLSGISGSPILHNNKVRGTASLAVHNHLSFIPVQDLKVFLQNDTFVCGGSDPNYCLKEAHDDFLQLSSKNLSTKDAIKFYTYFYHSFLDYEASHFDKKTEDEKEIFFDSIKDMISNLDEIQDNLKKTLNSKEKNRTKNNKNEIEETKQSLVQVIQMLFDFYNLYSGDFTAKNHYLKEGSRLGSMLFQYKLGYIHAPAYIYPQIKSKSVYNYLNSAKQSFAPAQYDLAKIYYKNREFADLNQFILEAKSAYDEGGHSIQEYALHLTPKTITGANDTEAVNKGMYDGIYDGVNYNIYEGLKYDYSKKGMEYSWHKGVWNKSQGHQANLPLLEVSDQDHDIETYFDLLKWIAEKESQILKQSFHNLYEYIAETTQCEFKPLSFDSSSLRLIRNHIKAFYAFSPLKSFNSSDWNDIISSSWNDTIKKYFINYLAVTTNIPPSLAGRLLYSDYLFTKLFNTSPSDGVTSILESYNFYHKRRRFNSNPNFISPDADPYSALNSNLINGIPIVVIADTDFYSAFNSNLINDIPIVVIADTDFYSAFNSNLEVPTGVKFFTSADFYSAFNSNLEVPTGVKFFTPADPYSELYPKLKFISSDADLYSALHPKLVPKVKAKVKAIFEANNNLIFLEEVPPVYNLKAKAFDAGSLSDFEVHPDFYDPKVKAAFDAGNSLSDADKHFFLAKYWLIKASEQGYSKAQIRLGELYALILNPDISNFFSSKKKAVSLLPYSVEALINISGSSYLKEQRKNLFLAEYWLIKAFEQNFDKTSSGNALITLDEFYEKTKILDGEINFCLSRYWTRKYREAKARENPDNQLRYK